MGKLTVTIQDMRGVRWHGEADMLSAHSVDGPFCILPSHAEFVYPLKAGDINIDHKNVFTVNGLGGMLSVKNDQVYVLVA